MNNGLIHVYYGDAKGKTTSAVGLLLRAIGANKTALYISFLKDGQSSEISQLKKLGAKTLSMPMQETFFYRQTDLQKKSCKNDCNNLFSTASQLTQQGKYDIIVLDEILWAITLDLIEEDKIISMMKNKHPDIELVLTGGKASEQIINLADYVTYLKKIKHPFDQGQTARLGIEF